MKKKILTIALFVSVAVSSFILGTTQVKTVEVIPDGYIDMESDEFFENYIDMRTVVNFEANENGLQLYTNDGNGYYWEK